MEQQKTDVANLRKEYNSQGLLENDLPAKPYPLFKQWFDEAVTAKMEEPRAMCLTTVDGQNKPSARYVILRGHDETGFLWYTNYESRKSVDMLNNPNAALTFWWGPLERSVRIEGKAIQLTKEENDSYFDARSRAP